MLKTIIPIKVGATLAATPHYLVESQVGAGRYSTVFQVRDTRSDRHYAAKVFAAVNGKATRPAMERFEREIYLGVGLAHTSVMRLMSVVHVGHVPIPLYEFAAGGNLYELVEEFDQIIALETALVWMGQAAEGVAYLHGRGIIHRDITPKNILIRDNGTVFLGDLGMALDKNSTLETEKYAANIAPIHVSLKQHNNPNDATELDDIFSLGQTYFFMLTRQLPTQNFSDIRRHNPDCPEDLRELINAMRHPDERHRPKSALDVVQQCKALLERRNLYAA